jgi:DNA-binding response OmpR family regulator
MMMDEGITSQRVLLAVPSVVLRAEYRMALSRAGYRVAFATDGIDCLRVLGEFHPDALVLDIDLLWGGADGVLEAMRAESENAAAVVMVIGSQANKSALYRVARFAVNDFQAKPVSGHQLVRRIGDMLDLDRHAISRNRSISGNQ